MKIHSFFFRVFVTSAFSDVSNSCMTPSNDFHCAAILYDSCIIFSWAVRPHLNFFYFLISVEISQSLHPVTCQCVNSVTAQDAFSWLQIGLSHIQSLPAVICLCALRRKMSSGWFAKQAFLFLSLGVLSSLLPSSASLLFNLDFPLNDSCRRPFQGMWICLDMNFRASGRISRKSMWQPLVSCRACCGEIVTGFEHRLLHKKLLSTLICRALHFAAWSVLCSGFELQLASHDISAGCGLPHFCTKIPVYRM